MQLASISVQHDDTAHIELSDITSAVLHVLQPSLKAAWPSQIPYPSAEQTHRLAKLSSSQAAPGSAQSAAADESGSLCTPDMIDLLREQMPALAGQQPCSACCPLCGTPCVEDSEHLKPDSGQSSKHSTQHSILGLAGWKSNPLFKQKKLCSSTCSQAIHAHTTIRQGGKNVSMSPEVWEREHAEWAMPPPVGDPTTLRLLFDKSQELLGKLYQAAPRPGIQAEDLANR